MFSSHVVSSEGFQSSWKKTQTVTESGTQTDKATLKDAQVQSKTFQDSQVQANVETKPMLEPAFYDWPSVYAFLRKTTPLMIQELEKASRSKAFKNYRLRADTETGSTKQLKTLFHPSFYKTFQCSGVSWNSTGTVLALSYGASCHDSWCTDDSGVCLWNLQRKDFDGRRPNNVLDTDSCMTAVAFHHQKPALLAAGSFHGEVLVWDVSQEADVRMTSSTLSEEQHQEPVTGIYWNKETDATYDLCTYSLDGKILFWKIDERSHQLELVDGFVILTDSLPKNMNIKSSSGDSVAGVTSLSYNYEDSAIFVIGTEGGAVLQCSHNAPKDVSFHSRSVSVSFKSPIIMDFNVHKGHVTDVHCSPFSRNVFLSCGADKELRIYSLLQPQPVLVHTTDSAFVKARFSPTRPLIIATLQSNGYLKIFDLRAGLANPLISFPSGSESVPGTSMEFCVNSPELLCTGLGNGTAQVWELSSGLIQLQESDEFEMLSSLGVGSVD